jgi:hypothetical protein
MDKEHKYSVNISLRFHKEIDGRNNGIEGHSISLCPTPPDCHVPPAADALQ